MTTEQIEFERYIQSKEFFDYSPPTETKTSPRIEHDLERPHVSTSDYLISGRSTIIGIGDEIIAHIPIDPEIFFFLKKSSRRAFKFCAIEKVSRSRNRVSLIAIFVVKSP